MKKFEDYYTHSEKMFLNYAQKFKNIANNQGLETNDFVSFATVNALKGFKKFKGEQNDFDKWFCIIIRNVAINFSRKKKLASIDVGEYSIKRQLGYIDQHIIPEKTMGFEDMVKLLPERTQEILILFCKEGYTLDEIAQKLNIPSGTVKSRLYYRGDNKSKVLEKLKKKIYI